MVRTPSHISTIHKNVRCFLFSSKRMWALWEQYADRRLSFPSRAGIVDLYDFIHPLDGKTHHVRDAYGKTVWSFPSTAEEHAVF